MRFSIPTANQIPLTPSRRRLIPRTAIGLIHTCRQLREEFQPLEIQDVEIEVDLRVVNRLIADLVPKPEAWRNQLDIEVPRSYYTFDLMPLVRFQNVARSALVRALTAPQTRIGFDSPSSSREYADFDFSCLITNILFLSRTQVWRDYTQDALVNITVDYHGSMSWTIEVNKDAKEDWMPWDAGTTRESCSKQTWAATRMWKMRVGLGHMIMPNVVVASD